MSPLAGSGTPAWALDSAPLSLHAASQAPSGEAVSRPVMERAFSPYA